MRSRIQVRCPQLAGLLLAGQLLAATPSPAWAAGPPAPNPKEGAAKPAHRPRTTGWFPKLNSSLNGSLVYNYHVPGIDDGLSVTLGLVLDAQLAFKQHAHKWLSTLKVLSSWSKTATQPALVKTADTLEVTSLYFYRFKRLQYRLAVFGGLALGASMFPGDLVVSEDTDLLLKQVDGTVETDIASKNVRFRLTPAFSPLLLKQLVGVWARVYAHEAARLDLRVSFVGQEVWAEGYAVDDDRSTAEKELRQLQDYLQAGVQLDVQLSGELKKHLTYSFNAELMYPVHTSVETPIQSFDLMNVDLSFRIGVKLGKRASLDYQFSAKRLPMLVTSWQITNNLVLSVMVNLP
ncbi:MAG: hypothetical protein ABI333_16495 [bacterium]